MIVCVPAEKSETISVAVPVASMVTSPSGTGESFPLPASAKDTIPVGMNEVPFSVTKAESVTGWIVSTSIVFALSATCVGCSAGPAPTVSGTGKDTEPLPVKVARSPP
jgi:hypothetical protein